MSLVFIILMVLWTNCCTGKILGMRFFSHVYQQIGWGELCGSRELVHNVADELDEWLIPNGSVSAVLANHGSSKRSHALLLCKYLAKYLYYRHKLYCKLGTMCHAGSQGSCCNVAPGEKER